MKMAANKFKIVATKIKYNKFYLRHLKFKLKIVVFTCLPVYTMQWKNTNKNIRVELLEAITIFY